MEVEEATVAATREGEPVSDVHIIDCHQSWIYLLAPVRSVLVLGCTGCTVVLGAVSRAVTVDHCERLRMHATCNALRVANCIEVRVYACANTRPVITGENHRLQLAPFAAAYARLEEDMQVARVRPQLSANRWADPVQFSNPGAAPAPGTLSLLPPERFLPFTVPFEFKGDVSDGERRGPCQIPHAYLQALTTARSRLEDFQAELSRVAAAPAVKEEVQAAVHRRFKEWLVKTGNMRQVQDLMQLDAAGGAGATPGRAAPDSAMTL